MEHGDHRGPVGLHPAQRNRAEERRYCPAIRKLIMMPNMVGPNEARENFKTYDPDTNCWEPLPCTWKPKQDGISPHWVYGHAPIVYDAKRQGLVLICRRSAPGCSTPPRRRARSW